MIFACVTGPDSPGAVSWNRNDPQPAASNPTPAASWKILTFIPYDGASGVHEFEKLNRAIEAAKLKVPIAESYPLERAARAHERFAEGHVLGKIVLRVHHP